MSDLEDRVAGQLAAWGLAETAEGAAALDIARRLGEDGLSPAAAAMLHGQLRTQLVDLRKLSPVSEGDDAVDELAAQREQRRRAAGMA